MSRSPQRSTRYGLSERSHAATNSSGGSVLNSNISKWQGMASLAPMCVGKLRRFAAPEVARHAALGPAAVDRQERDVDAKRQQQLGLPIIRHAVAAVVDRDRRVAEPHDIAEKLAAAVLVALDRLMRGRHGMKA